MAEHELLDLVKLMDAEDTLGILAMSPGLLPEAGRDPCELHGERIPFEDLIHEHGSQRMFRGGDEMEILSLHLVERFLERGEIGHSLHGLSGEHVWWLDDLESSFPEEIDSIEDRLDDAGMELLPEDFDPDGDDSFEELFETQRYMVKALIREMKQRYNI